MYGLFKVGVLLALVVLFGCETAVNAAPNGQRVTVSTRLFWQDHESMTVRWVDAYAGETPSFGRQGIVAGFPKLDAEHLKLVQMKAIGGTLLVGVRDDADGKLRSGWIAIDTGVREVPHGNHSHWYYDRAPRVISFRLDAKQGNPAHLYVYDDEFYLANDRNNGYTRLAPQEIRARGSRAGRFYPGGGNHITLAAVGGDVGYSSWIDGGGPNTGRVDVTDLNSTGKPEVAYQITLPTGVIHGAETAAGKVFFAPQDGICWVKADPEADDDPDSVEIHHIRLGGESDAPHRTGAFAVQRDWLLFTTGKGEATSLGMLDASSDDAQPILVGLDADEDHKATTPVPFRANRRNYAALFLDYEDPESDEELLIVSLDPDRNRDRSDAKVVSRVTVGNSAVDGHFGHHSLAVEPGGDFLFLVNPGDATLVAIDCDTWQPVTSLKLTGQPSALLSVGEEAD